MRTKLMIWGAWGVSGVLGLIGLMSMAGCALFSTKEAAPPTALEAKFFDVTTNYTAKVVMVANVIPIIQTNVETVTVTNVVNQNQVVVTPITVTNTVTNLVTQMVPVTNQVPVYSMTPGSGAKAMETIGGAAGAPFGVGGLVTTAVAGLFAAWAGLRNRALSGTASTAQEVSGVLAQNVETLKEVLATTPQGQQLAPLLKNYLVQHQAEAGVVQEVAAIVNDAVDNPAAKESASSILGLLKTIQGPQTSLGPVGAVPVTAAKS